MATIKIVRLLVADALASLAKGNQTDAIDALEDADRQLLEALKAQTTQEAHPCA